MHCWDEASVNKPSEEPKCDYAVQFCLHVGWHLKIHPCPSDIYMGSQQNTLVPTITRFMGPILGPSGPDMAQVGLMLAPWTLLSGSIQLTQKCLNMHDPFQQIQFWNSISWSNILSYLSWKSLDNILILPCSLQWMLGPTQMTSGWPRVC